MPVDFSLQSMKTLAYASELAQSLEASLCVIHVLAARPLAARIGAVPPLVDLGKQELAEAAYAKLLAVTKRKVHRQVPCTVWVGIGEPDREILAAAAAIEADALVLHTQVKPGIEDFLHNGITRRVVYDTPCPVLAIPHRVLWQSGESLPLVRPDEWRNILIPMAMTGVGEQALFRGLALAGWFNANATAFNVLRTGRLHAHYRPTRVRNRRFFEAKRQFSTWVRRHTPPGLILNTCVGVGKPAPTFLQAARHLQAHLIVMGTQQFSGWRRLRAVRTISRILGDTPCPVLSIPQPPGGAPGEGETA